MSDVEMLDFRSVDELKIAITSFSDADWVRLRKVAVMYSSGRGLNAKDLLQEAIFRALKGDRHCKRQVSVVKFLAEAMRSIASGELEKTAEERRLVIRLEFEGGTARCDPPDSRSNAEEMILLGEDAAERRRLLITLFEDDVAAQMIVEGILEGIKGEELRNLVDLDETTYQSKRRLIRRRIEKHLLKGLMP